MPPLPNQKHENFCQLTIQGTKYGWSQADIYLRSGYTCDKGSAAMAASRLMKNNHIRARIAELNQPLPRKARTTVDSLAEQFDAVFDAAMGSMQFSAAGSAAGAKAKLLGFMREKIEIGGGDKYEGCSSVEEIIDLFISGGDTPGQALDFARELTAMIEARVANMAIDITPKPPVVYQAEVRGRGRKSL